LASCAVGRQAAGFNQRRLADRAGVCLAAIRDLEQGPHRRPRRLRLADRIAVVGAGRIREIGIHDELSQAGGACLRETHGEAAPLAEFPLRRRS
jgi:transcriptional regulator with XRE-family HTH domain